MDLITKNSNIAELMISAAVVNEKQRNNDRRITGTGMTKFQDYINTTENWRRKNTTHWTGLGKLQLYQLVRKTNTEILLVDKNTELKVSLTTYCSTSDRFQLPISNDWFWILHARCVFCSISVSGNLEVGSGESSQIFWACSIKMVHLGVDESPHTLSRFLTVPWTA